MTEVQTKAFAGYEDFAACEGANSDKNDPAAYCASIQDAVEGKGDTDWLGVKDWPNDRTVEVFINDTREDYEGDMLPLEGQVAAMPWFMANGFLEWMHGMDTGGTPVPIGRPIAWRIRDMKIECRFGVWSSAETGHPQVDKWWGIIKKWGKRGTVSVTFAPIGQKEYVQDGHSIVLKIPKAWIWSAGWVGPYAASPGSTVNDVSQAKSYMQQVSQFAPQLKATVYSERATISDAEVLDILEGCNGCESKAVKRLMKEGGLTEDDARAVLISAIVRAVKFKSRRSPDGNRGSDMADDGAGSAQTKDDCPEGKKKNAEGECVDVGNGADEKASAAAVAKAVEEYLASRKSPEPEKKMDCPEGEHYDEGKGECVKAEGPKNAEEAMKAVIAEQKEQRALLMRLMAEQQAANGPAIQAQLEKAFTDAGLSDEQKAKFLAALPKSQEPLDIEARVEKMAKDFAEGVRAELTTKMRENMNALETTITEVKAKARMPAGKPQSQEDARAGTQTGPSGSALSFVDEKIVPNIGPARRW